MTQMFKLTVFDKSGESRLIEFSPTRMFNGGLAGSDPDEVAKHVEELAKIGIPPLTSANSEENVRH